jgi:broad specificity phosphatase PhoE
MQVTFLRHGESEHNAGLTTNLDSRLTPLGEQQSLATAQRFRKNGVNRDNTIAFVSPLLRTLQTLQPTVMQLALQAEVFADVCEYFSIRNDGYRTFEGLSTEQIQNDFPWAQIGTHFVCEDIWWPRNPENDLLLYDRASKVRDQLIAEYFDTKMNLLIVSHADPIGRMIEAFLRIPPNLDGPPWSGNCSVTQLLVKAFDRPAEVLTMNDTSHLSALSLLSPR